VAIRTIRNIKAFRRSHGYTQVQFAGLLRIKASTLVSWERGEHRPSGAQRTIMQLMAADPDFVLRTLRTGRPHLRPTRRPIPIKKTA